MYVECSLDIFQWLNHFPVSNNVSRLWDLGVCCRQGIRQAETSGGGYRVLSSGLCPVFRHSSLTMEIRWLLGVPSPHSPSSVTPAWKQLLSSISVHQSQMRCRMPLQRPMLRLLWQVSLDCTASPVGRAKPIGHRLRVCRSKEGAPLIWEERQWAIKLDKNEWQTPRGNTVPYSQVGGFLCGFHLLRRSRGYGKLGIGKQGAPLCRSLRTEGQSWAQSSLF